MSPYLPVTPDQIAAEAIAAAEAGASILHLHARDPKDGRPTADPDVFMQFLPRIKQATDAVINITTGGSSLMSLDERLAAPLRAEPEMCSLNMGSMNFALFPVLDKPTEWQHEWEPKLLEATRGTIFKNTFADMETSSSGSGEGCGTRFEFECYDVGHLYSLAHFRDRGLVSGPLFIQFVLRHSRRHRRRSGKPDPHEAHRRQAVRRRLRFSVLAAGRHQMPMIIDGGGDGRQCPRRAGGQPLRRPRATGEVQCRTGAPHPRHPRRACRWRSRRPTEAREHAGAEGRRPGGVLMRWTARHDAIGHRQIRFATPEDADTIHAGDRSASARS